MARSSLHIDTSTEPPGADIYRKEYDEPDSEWLHLGTTPIDSARVPVGIFRAVRVRRDGFEQSSLIEDSQKLAYYGMSWGGVYAPNVQAVEDRLHASILVPGGLHERGRPEAHQINYIGRVTTPTLMLNGKYDTIFPYESSIKPMFDLLGAPDGRHPLAAAGALRRAGDRGTAGRCGRERSSAAPVY